MSQILASPLSGWLNISATGASFAGSRDLSALVAVEFLPAGGQQVYYNFEHNHDGVYSGVSHNHNGVYSLVSHSHPVPSFLKFASNRYIGNNMPFVFDYGALGWVALKFIVIHVDCSDINYFWHPHHGSSFVDNYNIAMYANKITNSGGVFTITAGTTAAVKEQTNSSSHTYDMMAFGI